MRAGRQERRVNRKRETKFRCNLIVPDLKAAQSHTFSGFSDEDRHGDGRQQVDSARTRRRISRFRPSRFGRPLPTKTTSLHVPPRQRVGLYPTLGEKKNFIVRHTEQKQSCVKGVSTPLRRLFLDLQNWNSAVKHFNVGTFQVLQHSNYPQIVEAVVFVCFRLHSWTVCSSQEE